MEKLPEFDLTSLLTVELVDHSGNDESIIRAAKVSTGSDQTETPPAKARGLINYLVKNRHGSPFEHAHLSFRVKAPIFVFREFMRHRVGWSYNEVSGRYKVLDPLFYICPDDRPLVQGGSGAHPDLQFGENHDKLLEFSRTSSEKVYRLAWEEYCAQREIGIANEVARNVLPVGMFSEMYVSCNPRSLMSFLSLRVLDENALFESKPQWEIDSVARKMEKEFSALFPLTHEAFIKNRRVAP